MALWLNSRNSRAATALSLCTVTCLLIKHGIGVPIYIMTKFGKELTLTPTFVKIGKSKQIWAI